MNSSRIPILVILLCEICVLAAAEPPSGGRHARAPLPDFTSDDAPTVFFDDLFSHLVGKRVTVNRGSGQTRHQAPGGDAGLPDTATPPSGESPSAESWSRIISAATIEDEIKSLKLKVDQTVTTPTVFAGKGHQTARLDFSLLAILFAVVDQFDGDVRWRESAAVARDQFARTASNLKAGGSIQVYNEAKQRKQDLGELVRGSRLLGSARAELAWSDIAERSPIMELLESRLESNLKGWTSSHESLRSHREEVVREAELTASLATVLLQQDMDDADDESYRQFAQQLQQGGMQLARAARTDDGPLADQAMTAISRSCVDCHADYR